MRAAYGDPLSRTLHLFPHVATHSFGLAGALSGAPGAPGGDTQNPPSPLSSIFSPLPAERDLPVPPALQAAGWFFMFIPLRNFLVPKVHEAVCQS